MMNYQTSKKIRFFGDSWYWNWYGPGVYDYELTSETLKKSVFYDFRQQMKIPSISLYLKELGYETEVYNQPGTNFFDTTQQILKNKPSSDTTANIIFFSSLIRTNNYKIFPVNNYNDFMDKIKNDTIVLLRQIFNWAEENKTYVLIVGGQSYLPKKTFEAAGNSNYVFLIAECLPAKLASLIFKKDIEPYGMFRVACFTKYIDESWDKELVNTIYEDVKKYRHSPFIKLLTYPDYSHLNALSSFAFVDMMFNKIENLQLIK